MPMIKPQETRRVWKLAVHKSRPWHQYQEQVAEVFRAAGCDAMPNAPVEGVRARHKVGPPVPPEPFPRLNHAVGSTLLEYIVQADVDAVGDLMSGGVAASLLRSPALA